MVVKGGYYAIAETYNAIAGRVGTKPHGSEYAYSIAKPAVLRARRPPSIAFGAERESHRNRAS